MSFIEMYNQQLSLIGAFFILIAYVGQQFKWSIFNPQKPLYSILNALGATILTIIAFKPFVVGFVILEGIWALVSIVALFKVLR